MEIAFRLVDVFTEVPFAGNQLCVVPDSPADLEAATMAMLSREIGFSETTFVQEADGDRYRMRIFTPEEELPFAGHPTLGTALTLATEGRIGTKAIQTTSLGDIYVDVDLDARFAWMRQQPPVFGKEFGNRELAARAASLTTDDLAPDLPTQVISTGLGTLLVPVRDEATLRRAQRDSLACEEVRERSGGDSVYLFAVRSDGDVMARMFYAGFGMGEDAATGSAAGSLGAYLASLGLAGMPGRVTISQGEMVGRPSFLHVDVGLQGASFIVRVGGGVRIVGSGSFRV
jgi:trans-2,3-dihydro-3-hydroxyanthranilate isomerase